MGRLVKYLYLAWLSTLMLCISYNTSFSQERLDITKAMKHTIPKEDVVLHINSDLLLTGETLYYKLFCLIDDTNELSNVSKIAYVQLLGENEKIIFKHKLKLDGGIAYGDYFLPSDIKTGNYKLVAYSMWMKNNETNPFFQKDIYIINPYLLKEHTSNYLNFKDKTDQVQIKKSSKVEVNIDKTYADIKLETDIYTYKPRSKVTLKINKLSNAITQGNFSVSVRKVDSVGIFHEDNTVFNNEVFKKESANFFLPELRGEILSGLIMPKNKELNVSNRIIALTIPGSNFIYKNVRTDINGRFYFNINEYQFNSKGVIQVVDSDKENFKIILDDNTFKPVDMFKFKRVSLNSNINDWLQTRSVYNQIENAYNSTKYDSIISFEPNKLFYNEASIVYVLDDYKRFSTLRETFIEVVEGAAIRKSKGDYKFKVFSSSEELEKSSFINSEPLVLIDGAVIQDSNYVLDYNPFKISQIGLVKGVYFYGPKIYNGIIDIKTKKGDFTLPKTEDGLLNFNLDNPKESKVYYHPNYIQEKDKLSRIPDYRCQLLWLPNMSIMNEMKPIEFFTSDVEGVYEIVIEGYTLNGNYKNSKSYFEVRNI